MKRAPLRRAAVVMLVFRSSALTAQLSAPPSKVVGADFDALIKRGVPPAIANLTSATSEIVGRDEGQIHFVQTFHDGSKRDVVIKITPAENRGIKRVLQLDGGDVILSQQTSIKVTKNSYAVAMAYFIPASVLGEKTGQDGGGGAPRGAHSSFGMSGLLTDGDGERNGPSVRSEPQPGTGLSVTLSDVGTGASASTSFLSGVSDFLNGSDLVTAGTAINDVRQIVSAPQVNPAAPTTLTGRAVSGASNLVSVGSAGYNVWGIGKKHWVMKDRLRALRKCAENPTSPLAQRAQREDPNYRRATTEPIDRAERDLDINSSIQIAATTANGAMSALLSAPGVPLGSQLAKAVGIIDQVEQKMLDDVANAYIMADAGKGVVPCGCEPVVETPTPTEEVASYPPAELSCNPSPEELVCRAASPASSSQPTAATPARPQPVAACVPPTHADFTWRRSSVTSGCSALSCGFRSEEAFYAGSAALKPRRDGKGYEGTGTGRYGDATHEEGELRLPVPCRSSVLDRASSGPGALRVNAMFSINNTVTGGLDTGGMPENTTVVEILTNGSGLHDEEHKRDCDGEKSESIDNQVMGFDCHFYGVALDRPGLYVTYKDRDAHSGVCMLILR